jgi:TetR/AcrR family tetracycline transcriptional repressor
VTIRRLAQDHKVSPMALYWHFDDKDKIFGGIAAKLIADIELPPLTDDPSHDQLRALMEAVLAALRPHPALADLVPNRFLESDAGLEIAERTLELLRRGGLPEQHAAEISGYLLSSLVGMVAVEPGRQYGTDPEEREDAIRVRAASLMALSPRKYPNVIQAGSRLLASASPDAYYQLGVDMLVAGLIGVATRVSPTPSSESAP